MRTAVAAIACVAVAACGGPANERPVDSTTGAGSGSSAPVDPVVSTFMFFGGCRLDYKDLDPEHNPSSANLAELSQTLLDAAALPVAPKYWFFIGDLVEGLGSGAILKAQLEGWAKIYEASALSHKTTLVPVTGNHETLVMATAKGSNVELPSAEADAVWDAWQHAHHFDGHAGNGPTAAAPNADALRDDQSKLTYSFDDGSAHYVVLNTDTWTSTPDAETGSTQIAWVPLHWLEADLAAAETNSAITAIYIFGHKPLLSPKHSTLAVDAINPALAPEIIATLDRTTKVKGYFTSHAHQWQASQLPGAHGVWQIIAGNGGSPPDSYWKEPNYFGFTIVKTYASGKVGVVSYRRPAPTPYNAPTSTKATPADEIVIAPGVHGER